jgi:DNA-binding transcriptional LysR family regulator
VQLVEDKTVRLLPRLLSGRLDLAFVRPPERPDKRLEFLFCCTRPPSSAVAERHPLASRKRVTIADLENQPLIVPERRSRPHSHDLTMKLFAEAGCEARVAQIADEKQTIVNLVSAGLGVAIVPRWTSRMATARRPLHPPGSDGHEQAAAGGGLHPRHPLIPCVMTSWKC